MKKTFTGWIWKPEMENIGDSFQSMHRRETLIQMPPIYKANDDYGESIKVKVTVETVKK